MIGFNQSVTKLVPLNFVHRTVCYGIACLAVLLAGTFCYGQDKVKPSEAVKVIGGGWFDKQTQQYVPPALGPHRDNELRTTGRELEGSSRGFLDLLLDIAKKIGQFIRDLAVVMAYGLKFLLLLIVLVVVFLGIVHIRRAYSGSAIRSKQQSVITIDPERIEDLPFEAMQNTTDPLGSCRQLIAQGRYDEAIVFLFAYQLLVMDQARRIHLHKGKTNRMYVRELKFNSELQSIVQLTIDKFEQVFFGKHSLTKHSFEEAWSKLDRFHALIQQAVTAQPSSFTDLVPAGEVS